MSLGQQAGFNIGGPAPVDFNMAQGVPNSYDGLRLTPGGGSQWRHPPSNVPLQSAQASYFVTQGNQVPLASEMVFQQLPKDSMFYFARNQVSPACCPGTYSSSSTGHGPGCVCLNKEQRNFIGQQRGGNNDYPTNPPI